MAGQGDSFRALPRTAQRYLTIVHLSAAGAVATTAATGPVPDWPLLAVAAVLCLAGKALEAFAPGNYALQPSYAILVWGCLLSPPWAAPVLALACFAADLRRRGPAAYKVLFNIANYTLVGVLVAVVGGPGGVGAMLAAAIAAAVANHALIVGAIALAGELPLRATLRQITDGLPLSAAVGLMGAVLAVLWRTDPALLALAAGPLALLYRALWVPMLRHRADTDPKTGLYHSERIREELEAQVAAAGPAGRVAVAMIDLDHLRAINSRCGHLAGDRAIRAVADELAALAAAHGAAGRFGGEEFCLVLPGLDGARAERELTAMLERLRGVEFREAPDLRVSFSAGVAVHPDHAETVDALLSCADAALYDAKAAGRARVRIALSPSSREALAVPAPPPEAAVQPLPAASSGASRIAAAVSALGRRRATDAPAARLTQGLDDMQALLERMQRNYLETLVALAGALEDKDPYSAGSTARVAAIAQRLATELGCSEHERRALALGVALRDIGRAGVRDSILLKGAPLDALEREEVRSQAELATRVLADLELPVTVKQMVRHHHERWDGTGYPDRLTGDEIPLGARILAVAESLDAMLSRRPYRPELPLGEALAELAAGAGRQFCPTVAAAAARCFEREPDLHLNVAIHASTDGLDALRGEHQASRISTAAGAA
jgi:diguanylate cyclase (GGDEF)-like protein